MRAPNIRHVFGQLFLMLSFLIFSFASNPSVAQVCCSFEDYQMEEKYYFPEIGPNGPGQLSPDGLRYYFSIEGSVDDQLYYIERKKIKKGFGDPIPVYGALKQHIYGFQPSISENGDVLVYTYNTTNSWEDNDLYIIQYDKKGNVSHSRPINEVNTPGEADAFPTIRNNGLHLYFTKDNTLYFASRNSLDEEFSVPKQVEFKRSKPYVNSTWISPDEKVLFTSSGYEVSYAFRDDVNETFNSPKLFSDEFPDAEDGTFIPRISLTADLSQIMIDFSEDGDEYVILYIRK